MPSVRQRFLAATLGLSFSLFAAAPSYAEGHWYAGVGAGEAYVEIDVEGSDENVFGFDEGDTAWKLFGGYQWDLPIVDLGIEAGYVDLASPVAQFPDFEAEFDPTGLNVWGVASVNLGPVGLFGKLGALAWDIEGQTTGAVNRDFDNSGTDLGYGIGARFTAWSLEFRAEYESYDIDDTENVEMFSAGIAWRF